MTVIHTDQWPDFLNAIEQAQRELALPRGSDALEECFFRGHSNADYELLPTLYRKGKHLGNEDLARLEADLFWEFQARAQELHPLSLTDWDYLFFMRHHGVSTRLLDWSESLGVAVYFALESVRGRPATTPCPCVWVLNPYELNQSATGGRDLMSPRYLNDPRIGDYGDMVGESSNFPELATAIYPIQRSNRMRAQRGWFTMHGSDRRGIEQQVPNALRKIEIGLNAVAGAIQFLEHAGLNEYSIYSDLDSLARELHRKNGIR